MSAASSAPTSGVINRDGIILETIGILANYPRENGGARARVTDLELAPSSDHNDDPGKMSLYVADYGGDQVNDGRLFEVDLCDPFWA